MVIPDSVTVIQSYAFSGCKNLSNINIPSNLQTVSEDAFEGCYSLIGTDFENILSVKFNVNILSVSSNIILNSLDNQELDENLGLYLNYSGALSNSNYLFIYVTKLESNNSISTKTLKYINDVHSDSDGDIITNYLPQNNYQNGQLLLSGNFGNKYELKILNPEVLFNPNGGYVEVSSKRINANEPYGELPIPVKAEYTFIGWADENNEIVTANTVCNIARNHVITAQWVRINQFNKFIYGQGLSSLTSLDKSSNSFGYDIVYSNDKKIVGTGTLFNVLDGSGQITDTLTAIVYGDVNGDGSSDGMDAIIYRCFIRGMISEDDFGAANIEASNCNHDAAIDEVDIAMVLQSGLGLEQINQEP